VTQTNGNEDWYELLQISPNAEPETIHRVYRLLARRFHPDNAQTGNDDRFRAITRAYEVLSNPEHRAKYDVGYLPHRPEPWQPAPGEEDNDFEAEQLSRLAVLEVLSGISALTAQESVRRRPVLVPPCTVSPFLMRALTPKSKPCQLLTMSAPATLDSSWRLRTWPTLFGFRSKRPLIV